jgi:hypothetical protein
MTAGKFPIAELPGIHDLPKAQFRIIRGLRLVVSCIDYKRDPVPELQLLFGSEDAARSFYRLMHRCGKHWPDSFIVQPPCCQQTSYDEILFTDLIAAVVTDDRPEFDRLLCEMLNRIARDDLFEYFTQFTRPFRLARQFETFHVDRSAD